jgi:hypothetical protein
MLTTRPSRSLLAGRPLQASSQALRLLRTQALPRRVAQRLGSPRRLPLWGLGLASLALSLVNGPLVLAAGAGLVTYQQLAQLSPQQWQLLGEWLQQQRHRALSPRHKTLLLSGTALIATYLTTALWAETHQLAVAIALGSQSLLTLALLAWLLRSPAPAAASPAAAPTLDALLNELTSADPLRRLIGVQRLSQRAIAGDRAQQNQLIDCFRLMLAQESEPLVRTALRQGLQQLRPLAQLPEGAPPVSAQPSKKIQQTSRLRRPIVEYIEP